MGEGLGGIGVELNSHSINRQPQPGNGRKQPISPYSRLICRKPRQVSCESQSETRCLKECRKMGEIKLLLIAGVAAEAVFDPESFRG